MAAIDAVVAYQQSQRNGGFGRGTGPQRFGGVGASSVVDQVTAEGDPNFSRNTAGSQAQVPAARAQYDLLLNQQRANKVAALYDRLGVSVPDNVRSIQEQGYIPREKGIGENLLTALGALSRPIVLGVQDVLGGSEEAKGFESPNIGDYFKAFTGNTDEVMFRTGHNPASGSEVLALLGWEEADNAPEKVLRGAADFLFQALTDPLTYVTFGASALGKKALTAGVEQVVQKTVREVAEQTVESALHSRLRGVYDDAFRSHYDDALSGLDDVAGDPNILEGIMADAENFALSAVTKQARNEVIAPVVTRNFKPAGEAGNTFEEWLPYLPAYATGGARIGVPFTQSTLSYGWQIPGTRGLGRHLVGDPWRKAVQTARERGVGSRTLDTLSSIADNLDKNHSLIRALKKGGIDGHTFVQALSGVADNALAATKNEAIARFGYYATKIVKETGADDQDKLNRLHKGLTSIISGYGRTPDIDDLLPVGSEAEKTVMAFADFARNIMDDYIRFMQEAAPEIDIGYLKGYVPMSMTGDMRDFLIKLASSPAYLTYEQAAGAGEKAAGAFFLGRVIDSMTKGGRVEAAIGTNRHLMKRETTLSPVVSLHDASNVQLFDPSILEAAGLEGMARQLVERIDGTARLSVTRINDYMEGVIKDLVENFDLKIKTPKQGLRVYNEDVFVTMSDYLNTMTETIMYRNLLKDLEQAGVILPKAKILDEQATIAAIAEKLGSKRIQGVLERTEAHRRGLPQANAERAMAELRKSGELTRYAGRRRLALSQWNKATKTFDSLVVAPRNLTDLGYRKTYLLDYTKPAPTGVQPIDEAYVDLTAKSTDTYLPAVETADFTRLVARGDLVRIQFPSGMIPAMAPPTVTVGANMKTFDGMDFQPYAIRKALEFLHARGFKGPVNIQRVNKKGEITALTPIHLTKVIREQSDEDAFMSVYSPLMSSLQGDSESLQALKELDVIRSVAQSFRRRHRGIKVHFQPEERDLGPVLKSLDNGDGTVKANVQLRRLKDSGIENIPWERIHGYVAVYDANKRKWYFAIAGGEHHLAAIDEITRKLRRDFKDITFSEIDGSADFNRYPQLKPFVGTRHPAKKGTERWETLNDGTTRVFGEAQVGMFSVQYPSGLTDEVRDYIDGIGLAITAKTKNNVYKVVEGDFTERLLHVTDNLFDPDKMDDLELYQIVFDTIRNLATTDSIKQARRILQESPLNQLEADLQGLMDPNPIVQAGALEEPSLADQLLAKKFPGEFFYRPEQVQAASQRALHTRDPNWWRKMVIGRLSERYGMEVVAAAQNTTKELAVIDSIELKFAELLSQIFSHGRGPDGELTAMTRFASKAGESFDQYLKEVAEYGEKLGINKNTFEAEWEFAPYVDPVLSNGKNFVSPGLFAVGGGVLDTKMVQADMAAWLSQLVKNMASAYTPMGVAQLKATSNGVLRLWKTMTTVTRPTFLIRNLVGGVWNNQIIGVRMRDYAHVRHGMIQIRRALRQGKNFDQALNAVQSGPNREMFRAAWNSGLLDLSFSRSEFRALSDAERTALAKRLGFVNPFSAENFVLARTGALFMESIEDFLRVSAFARWFDPADPLSARVAKEMSLGVHFDYKNLTEFETRVKHFVPFFVWQRRNLPLQLQTMIEQPGLMQRYVHLMDAIDEQFGSVEQDEYAASDYLSAYAAGTDIVLNENTPFWARIIIDPDVPVKDLFELKSMAPDKIMQYFLDSLGPGYQFAQDMIEQKDFGPINAPAPMNAVLSQMARIGFFDKTTDGDVQIPYLMRTLYNLAFPWSQEYEDIIDPRDPRRQQQVGMTEDDGNLETLLQRLGLVLGRGIGIQTQTPSQSIGKAAQAEDRLTQLTGELMRTNPRAETQWEDING